MRMSGIVNVNFLQNVTYPSCGDCLYGDFRGDIGEPGPKVGNGIFYIIFYMTYVVK